MDPLAELHAEETAILHRELRCARLLHASVGRSAGPRPTATLQAALHHLKHAVAYLEDALAAEERPQRPS